MSESVQDPTTDLGPPKGVQAQLVLGKDEIKKVVRHKFDESCVDAMGYDMRLGNHVYRVTKGIRVELKDDETIYVQPGETLVAHTLERLNLKDDVCATGSPKMSLLMKGLWSHGGKTDFGYNRDLLLSFTNLGSEEVPLKQGSKIFHLTFWRVPGRPKEDTEGGRTPAVPHVTDSVLESDPFGADFISSVAKRDGLPAARIVAAVELRARRFRRALVFLFLAVSIISVHLALEGEWSRLALPAWLWSVILTMLAGLASLTTVWDRVAAWIRKSFGGR